MISTQRNLLWISAIIIYFSIAQSQAQSSQNVDSLGQVQNKDSIITVSSIDSIGSPVIIEEDTLFYVKHSLGKLSIKRRARFINEELRDILPQFNVSIDSIFSIMDGNVGNVLFHDEIFLQVTEQDAAMAEVSVQKLTAQWTYSINQRFQKKLSQGETVLQYAFSIAIFLAFVFLLNFILKFVFKRVRAIVVARKGKYLKGIKIKDFEIMDANDELALALKAVGIIRFIFLLFLAYVTFPVFFRFFPATEAVAYQLIGLVYDPLKSIGWSLLGFIPNLFSIAIIVYIFRVILKYLKLFADKISSGRIKVQGFYPDWASTTHTIIRIMVIALGLVMVFPYLPGAQSDVFKGVSVFVGVIFSIGSTSVVGNLVAGLVLTYMRPFRIGDRIRIDQVEGEVVEKTAFVLRIKTPKNEFITVPNANALNSHIVNYNRSFDEGGVILYVEVTIGYDVPWRQVHELLLKAASQTEYLEKTPEPFVLQKALNDFSVAYQINGYSKRPLYKDLIYSLINQNIQDIFAEAGIEILSPNYMAQRDGNASTVPDLTKMKRPDTPKQPGKPNKADGSNKPESPDSPQD